MDAILRALLVAGLALLQAPATPQASMSLTGRVTTGSGFDVPPVRRAKVTLSGRGATRVTDTDTNGVYRFNQLSPGDYRITVQKAGFATLEADASPNPTLNMIRGGAIEGIVTDTSGYPLWNVVVAAWQRPDGEKPKAVAQVRTDDLGHYRLHSLQAGDYTVAVSTDGSFLQRLFMLAGEKRPDGRRVFYPSVPTLEEARFFRVSAGLDTQAIDISFVAPTSPLKDPAAPTPPPSPDATGTARVAGTIVDGTSGKPIPGARLLLLPVDGERLTNWTRSDSQGHFEYRSLQARRYTLRAEADRYVALEFGQKRPGETGRQIQVGEGEDFRADMKLPRANGIEGKVLDEFGDPAPGILVQVAQREYVAGRHRLMPTPARLSPVPTDDKGSYRVSGLGPGDYYVVARSGIYTDQNEVGGFAPTYYPGATDSGGAIPVTVALDADTTGMNFSLGPSKISTISGVMVDAGGSPVSGRGTLWLATPDRLQLMDFNIAHSATTPDGRFELRNVPQGTYTLQGFGPPPPNYHGPMNPSAMPFGWRSVVVGDSDIAGVVLKVEGGRFLRGRIAFDDASVAPPKSDQVRVDTVPVEFDSAPLGGGPPVSVTHDDWTFEVANQSGLRRIMVSFPSSSWAVKKIMLNGLDITDSPVDLRTKDVEGVDVMLTTKVSRIAGTVSDDKGLVSDYTVVIFPTDPTKWFDRSRFVVSARPTQQGRFEKRALPPDDYWAVALPNVVGQEFTDPEFLQQVRSSATAFTLIEGETKALDLKLKKHP